MSDSLDLLVILDRSGSMQSAKTDHEGGLKSFIDDQRELDGDVRLTLVQFDSQEPCEIVYDRTPLDQVSQIRLIPRGRTPLLDAVGKACAHLRAKIPSDSRVIAMVITDGEENASVEWTKERVRGLVKELEAGGWSFLFLGADIDAFSEAGAIGIAAAQSVNFTNAMPESVRAMYAATTSNVSGYRRLTALGASSGARITPAQCRASLSFTSAQRAAMAAPQPKGQKRGVVSRSSDSTADEETA